MSQAESAVDRAWARSSEDVLEGYASSSSGLPEDEAGRRLERYGPNRLRAIERRSAWSILWEQVRSLIMVLLVAAMFVSLVTGQTVEAIAVAAVIAINTAIGFFTEWRAVRSMEALRKMADVQAIVRRSGDERTLPAADIVPGDVVLLREGGVVPADARLISVDNLQIDEAALTGESVPVSKQVEAVDDDAGLADRTSMVYRGTAVSRGKGTGVVTGTGMATELGEIASMVEGAGSEATPLQQNLHHLGRNLVWLTIGVAAVITGAGLLAGRDLYLMIETGIALAVAAIPEGLPIVATVALAYGMRLMMKRNAFVRRLSSVETLGATTVIATDKTGTLTKNEMTVRQITQPDDRTDLDDLPASPSPSLRLAAEVAVLCNDADEHGGDPMEIALIELGERLSMPRDELLAEFRKLRTVAFSRDMNMMATYHASNEGVLVAVKGAPDAVLDACTNVIEDGASRPLTTLEREHWHEVDDEMARDGLRVLGLARKIVNEEQAEPYDELTFLGYVGLLDPPKERVRDVVEQFKQAGIRVVMVTGDHLETALNISRAVGLDEDGAVLEGPDFVDPIEGSDDDHRRAMRANVVARVTPEQKLSLIDLYQKKGEIVAMTGDGVNDAPALRSADIGVAMGDRGTDVAKEAADMVLQDDELSSMAVAIEHGRIIFENIRKFVIYLLSGNVGEILSVGVAATAGTALPLLPLQILYINILNDVFPALALGVGRGTSGVMQAPPRDPYESVVTTQGWLLIAGYGIVIAFAVLAVFYYALYGAGMNQTDAVTISFLTLSVTRLVHVFNMRRPDSGIVFNEITRNPFVWGAIGVCVGLLLVAVYVPGLASILGVAPPSMQGWLLVVAGSLVPLIAGQIYLASTTPDHATDS